MKISGMFIALVIAVPLSSGVSNAHDVVNSEINEVKAKSIMMAIDETMRLAEITEEMRNQQEQSRVKAIQEATKEALRLSNYCGSADPKNCI
jgi:hypothetical protein